MDIIAALSSSAHACRYRCPSNVTRMQTYGEARGGYAKQPFPFMGMRRFVIDYLSQPITQEMIDRAESSSPDFDKKMWQHILDEHCGYLPIKIAGRDEGQLCEPGEVLWTIESLDPKCAMLPLMLDKLIVSYIWFDSTIAQRLRTGRKIVEEYCEAAGVHKRCANYLMGGKTRFGDEYLTNVANSLTYMFFPQGVDEGVANFMSRYYSHGITGCSSRVGEHSSMILWDDESECLEELLQRHEFEWFSILADCFDYCDFIGTVVPEHKKAIKARKSPMTIAIDSEKYQSAHSYARHSLGRTFGCEYNHKGFKLIDAPICLAQIEDLTAAQIHESITELINEKWSPLNFYWHLSDLFMQENLSRITNGFVHKICYAEYEGGKMRDICKSPKHDHGKKTKRGHQSPRHPFFYYDGGFFEFDKLSEVRERLIK